MTQPTYDTDSFHDVVGQIRELAAVKHREVKANHQIADGLEQLWNETGVEPPVLPSKYRNFADCADDEADLLIDAANLLERKHRNGEHEEVREILQMVRGFLLDKAELRSDISQTQS